MIFPENYYQLHEIFKIERTGQQCFVVSKPIRKADNAWSIMVRLIDDDYSQKVEEYYIEFLQENKRKGSR